MTATAAAVAASGFPAHDVLPGVARSWHVYGGVASVTPLAPVDLMTRWHECTSLLLFAGAMFGMALLIGRRRG